jgi:predicted flap endonuclease-1-like 5' DNA nuclease
MLTVVFVLACSACALVCGGILGKAYFATRRDDDSAHRGKTQTLLEAQRARYRKRVTALNNVIRRHEETRDQIREKLSVIEVKYAERGSALEQTRALLAAEQRKHQELSARFENLESGQHSAAATEKELSVLRIERDELAARLARMSADRRDQAGQPTRDDESQLAKMREIMGALRESLATSDRRVHDLEIQLADSIKHNRVLQEKLDNWKQRVKPLTRQLTQQKAQLRQLSAGQATPSPNEVPGDDLQAIQGIGPVIEQRLHRQGIRSYRQLAALSAEELADISRQLSIAPNIPVRDAWIEQARDLCARDLTPESACT